MNKEELDRIKKYTNQKTNEWKKTMAEICEERHIKKLVHFTRAINLNTILEKGLLTPTELEAEGIEYEKNDKERSDNRDSICLSVSFPNYRMFYRLRTRPENSNVVWVVILLDPIILQDKYCMFFKKNAASSMYTKYADTAFMGIDDFENMFAEWGRGKWTRYEMGIECDETTNPQAEIHILEKIEPEHIIKIITEPGYEEAVKEYLNHEYDDLILDGEYATHHRTQGDISFFMPRPDYKSWYME